MESQPQIPEFRTNPETFTQDSKSGLSVDFQHRDPVQTASEAVQAGSSMFVILTGICEFKP